MFSHQEHTDRTVKTEATFTRVVALFGLYTFFKTQPSGSIPPLHSVEHIPIPYGTHFLSCHLPREVNISNRSLFITLAAPDDDEL